MATKRKIIITASVFITVVMIGFLCWLLIPITRKAEIVGFEWDRAITVEEYRLCSESGWSMPDGATLIRKRREIYSMIPHTIRIGKFTVTTYTHVYKTKYYYQIGRWVYSHDLKTHGIGRSPYWYQTDLPYSIDNPEYGDLRQQGRSEKYYAVIIDEQGSEEKVNYNFEDWQKLEISQPIEYRTFRFSQNPL